MLIISKGERKKKTSVKNCSSLRYYAGPCWSNKGILSSFYNLEHWVTRKHLPARAHPSPTRIYFVSVVFWARFCVLGSKATSWHGEFIHANEACTLTPSLSTYGSHTHRLCFSCVCAGSAWQYNKRLNGNKTDGKARKLSQDKFHSGQRKAKSLS